MIPELKVEIATALLLYFFISSLYFLFSACLNPIIITYQHVIIYLFSFFMMGFIAYLKWLYVYFEEK
ncbi:MAG: hypothetical protein WDZ41_03265 [Candidatus Babeliales bacterium]